MCAITVDIFIKVRKPLRYKTLMSKRRGNIIITCLWCIPILLLLSLLVVTDLNHINILMLFLLGSALYTILSLFYFFISIPIYIIIFCTIRSFMHRQPSSYRHSTTKTAVTFFLIMTSYFLCISPICVALVDRFILSGKNDLTISRCLYLLKTVLDPMIYATRIPEIRTQYKRLCNTMNSCFRQDWVSVLQ
jgi:hypothetical protein